MSPERPEAVAASADGCADAVLARTAPPLLAVVAGFVDGCTFVALFGLFVAQVTGSFVVAGAQIVAHDAGDLIKLLAIPVFLSAAALTTLLAAAAGRRALAAMLTLEWLLLAGFLAAGLAGAPLRDADAPAALAASLFGLAAMGVQSASTRLVFRRAPSTNVMTTNTVQLAIEATELALAWMRRTHGASAGHAYDQARARVRFLAAVALAFLLGTLGGALGYTMLGFWCVLAPLAVLAALISRASKAQASAT